MWHRPPFLPRAVAFRLASLAIAGVLVHGNLDAPRAAPSGSPAQGIGADDPRTRVDPNRAPWRAVGKLQASALSFRASCTGTLIAERTVLTAAHCLFNPRTRRDWPPSLLHFLVGFEGSTAAERAVVRSFAVAPGYDPLRPLDKMGSDWALLTLDEALGTPDRVLAMLARVPEAGTAAMIGGYGQDRAYALVADLSCRILGEARDRDGKRLLRHDCRATHGISGAPLLVREGGTWRVAGVDVAADRNTKEGLAVPLDDATLRGALPAGGQR